MCYDTDELGSNTVDMTVFAPLGRAVEDGWRRARTIVHPYV